MSKRILLSVLFAVMGMSLSGCSEGEAEVVVRCPSNADGIRAKVGDQGYRSINPGMSTTFKVTWDGGLFGPGSESVEGRAEDREYPSRYNRTRTFELEDGDRVEWSIGWVPIGKSANQDGATTKALQEGDQPDEASDRR